MQIQNVTFILPSPHSFHFTSLKYQPSRPPQQCTKANHKPCASLPTHYHPRNELDKVRVQLNTSLGIKDRGHVVSNEISGNILFVSVADDHALVRALGCSFGDGFDLVVCCALLKAHDGDVEGGDTERQPAE